MITAEQAHHGINISLHMLILFLFLSCFFFLFVSKIEQTTIQNEIDSAIKDNIPRTLNMLYEESNKLGIKIRWNIIDEYNKKIPQKYLHGDLNRQKHNRKLLNICILVIIIGIISIIGSIIYFTSFKKLDVKMGSIIIDNLIIFTFVGIIEYVFFTKVAFRYIPIKSSDLGNSLIERVKHNINKQLS